ncbi:Phorbol-ester/DAG-type domain-containing protein [Heracleum sosnowskyi]|uniref:Phorbol-ester/DAG-type domain-containing protein n=1 Tax=Heracleum sosnowskyi TaxID=360622 RepID=A0AAD8IAV9_9APIA|nr:Phorbol-ester/DAG-type domain-containing protein [Heracleum sosnowskyi]
MEISNNIFDLIEELYFHPHKLILNEDYHSREGHLCNACGLLLHTPSDVYRCIYSSSDEEDDCAHFFLHKTCAHLPDRVAHPSHQHSMERVIGSFDEDSCSICGNELKGLYYICYECDIYKMCLICIVPLNKFSIDPDYHRHKLTLSTSHHKHSLHLAYSLPEMYRKFPQTCRICTQHVYESHWLYYCPNCRFFAHIKCATTPPMFRNGEEYDSEEYDCEANIDESILVHLPAPDHESLLQQYIKKKKIIYWLEDAHVTPPVNINHWSHEQHQMVLKNRSGKRDDEGLLICNGCTKSISSRDCSDLVFYECSECDYILHQYCALLRKEMQLDLDRKLVGIQSSVYDIWSCTHCEGFSNGTQMRTTYVLPFLEPKYVKLDTECAFLPKLIKHEAHPHLVTQDHFVSVHDCSACQKGIRGRDTFFRCTRTRPPCYFSIHIKCALKPLKLTHRWDPHPLYLITSPEGVIDHPHAFHCEFCSEEINTNGWFYHCSVCDLSFHLNDCVDLFPYSRVKFGATNIKIRDHEHNLTFVLSKKRQPCQRCRKNTYGKPVLQCTPCKFIQHAQPDLCT